MSNQLIPVNTTKDAGLLELTDNSSSFHPRLKLFGGNSDACKEGKVPIGHYGLERDKDTIEDLTSEVDIIVCAGRTKALDTSGENPIQIFDHVSPEFARIKEMSEVQNSGCMWGFEYLVWVYSSNCLATLFLCSKTARRINKEVYSFKGLAATLKAKLIKTPKYKWHGPVIMNCTTPHDVPDVEMIKMEIEKFENPPAPTVETDDSDSSRE